MIKVLNEFLFHVLIFVAIGYSLDLTTDFIAKKSVTGKVPRGFMRRSLYKAVIYTLIAIITGLILALVKGALRLN